MKNSRKKGFTLVELLAIIVILAIIIGIIMISSSAISKRSKDKAYNSKKEMIVRSAELYGEDHKDKVASNACVSVDELVELGYLKYDQKTEDGRKIVIDPRDNTELKDAEVCFDEDGNAVYGLNVFKLFEKVIKSAAEKYIKANPSQAGKCVKIQALMSYIDTSSLTSEEIESLEKYKNKYVCFTSTWDPYIPACERENSCPNNCTAATCGGYLGDISCFKNSECLKAYVDELIRIASEKYIESHPEANGKCITIQMLIDGGFIKLSGERSEVKNSINKRKEEPICYKNNKPYIPKCVKNNNCPKPCTVENCQEEDDVDEEPACFKDAACLEEYVLGYISKAAEDYFKDHPEANGKCITVGELKTLGYLNINSQRAIVQSKINSMLNYPVCFEKNVVEIPNCAKTNSCPENCKTLNECNGVTPDGEVSCTIKVENESSWTKTKALTLKVNNKKNLSLQYSWDGNNFVDQIQPMTATENIKYTFSIKKPNGSVVKCEKSIAKIDTIAPKIELTMQEDTTYSKIKTIEVATIQDQESGLANDSKVQYGWSTSKTVEPSEYKDAKINSYTAGTAGKVKIQVNDQEKKLTGDYYLWLKTVYLSDRAGNSNGNYKVVSTGTFKFDNTAPTGCSLTYKNNDKDTWKQKKVLSVGQATDAHNRTVKYKLIKIVNNAETIMVDYTTTKPADQEITENGVYRLYLKDGLDNEVNCADVTGEIIEEKIDVGAPEFRFVSALPDDWSKEKTIKVMARDPESGLASISVKYGFSQSKSSEPSTYYDATIPAFTNGTTSEVSIEINTTANLTGTYYLWIKPTVTNVAGKTNNTRVIPDDTLEFDNTAPTCTITGLSGVSTKEATLEIVAQDSGGAGLHSTAYALYDGTNTIEYSSNNRFTINKNGTYIAYVKDRLDNIGTCTAVVTNIDDDIPIVEIVQNSNTSWSKTKTVTVKVKDAVGGVGEIVRVKYGVSENDMMPGTMYDYTETINFTAGVSEVPFNITFGNENERISGKVRLWVEVYASDTAGNAGNIRSISTGKYWLDNKAPIVKFEPEENTEWQQQQGTKVTVSDEHIGSVRNLYYQWNESAEEPPENMTQTGTPFTNGYTITKNNTTGSYYLWIYAEDTLGNILEVPMGSNSFSFDNTKPSVNISVDSKTSSTITVTGTCSDTPSGIAKYQFYVDGVLDPNSTTNPKGTYATSNASQVHTYTGLTAGSHTLKLVCTDKADNPNEKQITASVIDLCVPNYSVTGGYAQSKDVSINYGSMDSPTCGGGTYLFNATGKVTANVAVSACTENTTESYTCSGSVAAGTTLTAGQWYSVETNPTLTFTSNGTIIAKTADGVNHKDGSSTVVTGIDRTKPQDVSINNSSNGNWTNGNVTIKMSADDNEAPADESKSGIDRFEYSYDNATWSSSGVSLELPAEQPEITAANVTYTHNGQSTVQGALDDLYTKLGATNAQTTTTLPTGTIVLSQEQSSTLYTRAIDKAGNISQNSTSTPIKIDKTAPDCSWDTWNKTYMKSGERAGITLICTDSGSGIPATAITATASNGTVITPTVGSTSSTRTYTYMLTAPSNTTTITLTVDAKAVKDNVGNGWDPSNASTRTSSSIMIDNTAPTCNISYSTDLSESVTLTASATDAGGSGLASTPYSWDNDSSWSASASTEKNANGTYTVYVKDAAGNKSSCNATIDNIMTFTRCSGSNCSVCKKATVLHKAICNSSSGCGSVGSTITYGVLGSDDKFTSGEAFDCDVNGDGIYNANNERFYYVTDAWRNKNWNKNYAVLIAAHNFDGTTVDDNNGVEWATVYTDGPTLAAARLPDKTSWPRVSLALGTSRNIYSGSLSDPNELIKSDFDYSAKSSRLLTLHELLSACPDASRSSDSLNNCPWLLENTDYQDNSLIDGYWLETNANSSQSWSTYGTEKSLYNDTIYRLYVGTRPVIEVHKDSLEKTTSIIDTIKAQADPGLTYFPNQGIWRYTGANPNNYVQFNGELWRIISINQNDSGLKIIKDTGLRSMAYGGSSWNTSTVRSYLNSTYYNALPGKTKSMIINGQWDAGQVSIDTVASMIHSQSLSIRDTTSLVGLMSAADYAFAAPSGCLNTRASAYRSGGCASNDWLNYNNYVELTLNPITTSNVATLRMGDLYSYPQSYSNTIRPVVNISPKVYVTGGSGTSTNPYVLNIRDAVDPICLWGVWDKQYISAGDTAKIKLTCTDTDSGVSMDLRIKDMKLSDPSLGSIVSVAKSGTDTSRVYTFTFEAGGSAGTTSIILPDHVLRDNAYNYEGSRTSREINVNMDTTPPTKPTLSITQSNGKLHLVASSTDEESGIDGYRYYTGSSASAMVERTDYTDGRLNGAEYDVAVPYGSLVYVKTCAYDKAGLSTCSDTISKTLNAYYIYSTSAFASSTSDFISYKILYKDTSSAVYRQYTYTDYTTIPVYGVKVVLKRQDNGNWNTFTNEVQQFNGGVLAVANCLSALSRVTGNSTQWFHVGANDIWYRIDANNPTQEFADLNGNHWYQPNVTGINREGGKAWADGITRTFLTTQRGAFVSNFVSSVAEWPTSSFVSWHYYSVSTGQEAVYGAPYAVSTPCVRTDLNSPVSGRVYYTTSYNLY